MAVKRFASRTRVPGVASATVCQIVSWFGTVRRWDGRHDFINRIDKLSVATCRYRINVTLVGAWGPGFARFDALS